MLPLQGFCSYKLSRSCQLKVLDNILDNKVNNIGQVQNYVFLRALFNILLFQFYLKSISKCAIIASVIIYNSQKLLFSISVFKHLQYFCCYRSTCILSMHQNKIQQFLLKFSATINIVTLNSQEAQIVVSRLRIQCK